MKKILAFSMAVLMLALMLASCGKSDVPSGMKRVESDFIEYEFFVPNTWNVDVSNGFAAASDASGRTVSMTQVTPESGYESIDDYYRNHYMKTLGETFRDVTLTESYTENFQLGNVPACKYTLSFKIGDKEYTALQAVGAYKYHLYIFTYFATAENFEGGLESANKMIENIRF